MGPPTSKRCGAGALVQVTAVCAALSSSCRLGDSADNPNRNYPPTEDPTVTIQRWTVTDASSGAALAAGCGSMPRVSAATGSQLILTSLFEQVTPECCGPAGDLQVLCEDPKLKRSSARSVRSPACFRLEDDAPIRLLSQEVLPPDPPPATSVPLGSFVAGRGYRFTFEVLRGGHVRREPAGECDVEADALIIVEQPG
jgi:hypothetical protein